jgi:hypothetical protein
MSFSSPPYGPATKTCSRAEERRRCGSRRRGAVCTCASMRARDPVPLSSAPAPSPSNSLCFAGGASAKQARKSSSRERSSSTESGGAGASHAVCAALARALSAPDSCLPRPACRPRSELPSAGRRRQRLSQIGLPRPRSCALSRVSAQARTPCPLTREGARSSIARLLALNKLWHALGSLCLGPHASLTSPASRVFSLTTSARHTRVQGRAPGGPAGLLAPCSYRSRSANVGARARVCTSTELTSSAPLYSSSSLPHPPSATPPRLPPALSAPPPCLCPSRTCACCLRPVHGASFAPASFARSSTRRSACRVMSLERAPLCPRCALQRASRKYCEIASELLLPSLRLYLTASRLAPCAGTALQAARQGRLLPRAASRPSSDAPGTRRIRLCLPSVRSGPVCHWWPWVLFCCWF